MIKSKSYTDPIIYEEGFFADEKEEIIFLEKLQKRFETAIVELKAVEKGTIVPKKNISSEK